MFFNFFRPEPRFRPGQMARICDDFLAPNSYLLIDRRRWIKPLGSPLKGWVYDGLIFRIEDSELVYFTTMTCCLEESLRPVPGLK